MTDFSSIVGTEAWTEFLACRRDKRVFARPQAAPGRFRPLWSDWEFDAICRFTPLVESPVFRMIARGKQIPEAAYRGRESGARVSLVHQLWASGASINFSRVELFSNRVLALVRSLEASLRCPVRVHYFATPAQSQALGAHADHDEALVVQLRGEKTWALYPGSNDWPDDPEKAADLLRRNPPEVLTLGPGGWLYLPKGVYHEVRNAGPESSQHFTLGFHPLTWGTLMDQSWALARGAAPSLRDRIALDGGAAQVGDQVDRQLAELRPYVLRAFESERYGQGLTTGELAPRDGLDAADTATRFRWRRQIGDPRPTAAGVELGLPFRSLPLVLRTELAPTLAPMRQGKAFSPAELPGAPDLALALCRFLANVGVLELENAAGPA